MVAEEEILVLKTLMKDELVWKQTKTSANHTSVLYFYQLLTSVGPSYGCRASRAAVYSTLGQLDHCPGCQGGGATHSFSPNKAHGRHTPTLWNE